MFSNLNKKVKDLKSRQRNLYSLDNDLFNVIFYTLVVAEVCALLQPIIEYFPSYIQIFILIVAVTVGGVLLYNKFKIKKNSIDPYIRKENFSFLGLHDLSKEKTLNKESDVVPREEEIHYIKEMLDETILPQKQVKQILCLTGQSGCGKSTIISFFKNEYDKEYQFFDFTCDYNNIEIKIQEVFGTNPEEKIAELTYAGKVIIILDQFERYFFLSPEKKDAVRELIANLTRENLGIIISLRQEYLANFLKEFDMNNIKASSTDYKMNGIMRPLVSVIEDKKSFTEFVNQIKKNPYTEWDRGKIKNNYSLHLHQPSFNGSDSVVEKIDTTLFYCENQNMSLENKGLSLKDKCSQLSETKGLEYYEKHKNNPLIEQQIFFHMIEYDKKVRNLPEAELEEVMALNDADLLERYFDTQLASCDDFFTTSRILYLLSEARLHHVSVKVEDIKTGLYIDQFGTKGNDEFNKALEHLEKLQLIHRSIENSILEYEIAHDFIATSFLNYANSNMPRSVKGALDIFLSEYLNEENKGNIDHRRKYRAKEQKDHYFLWISYFCAFFAVIIDIIMRFFYNPWINNMPTYLNPYNEVLSFFIPFISFIAIIYLGQMYDKVLKYYHGPKEKRIRYLYIVLMIMAICSVAFYPHILLIDGLCCVFIGLTFMLLLDSNYQETSRNELWNYGFKTAMIGAVFALIHVMFFITNPGGLPTYLVFSEAVMLFILIVYSFIAHLTKENLYARMIDASSERKTEENK